MYLISLHVPTGKWSNIFGNIKDPHVQILFEGNQFVSGLQKKETITIGGHIHPAFRRSLAQPYIYLNNMVYQMTKYQNKLKCK